MFFKSGFVVAVLTLVCFLTLGAAPDRPAIDNNWLDESTWPELVRARAIDAPPNETRIAKLQRERFNAVQRELRNRYAAWLQGSDTSLIELFDTVERNIAARKELAIQKSDHLALIKEKLDFCKVLERQGTELAEKRIPGHAFDEDCTRNLLATVEIELMLLQGPDN